ncbi:MarR family winged helix-turn-helix transcriptional regulator [Streptomyces sp. NPDC086989]|uniref:MarR family winged helix-turn-helix transcriptional regulator n=1 Tax=Streptomyces sp. NPDC086989 TaxID=3365764 RepID=UPI003811A978
MPDPVADSAPGSVPGPSHDSVPGSVPGPSHGSALDPSPERARQDLLSRTALGVFGLNGRFLTLSEELARPAGLTAAWWQVLGAALREPLPVAGIARVMGITRQSVQRIADLLVAKGLAAYVPNPAHRRAKLLRPTEEGRAAVARITPAHAALADRLAEELGEAAFAETVQVLDRLTTALDALLLPAREVPADE